MIRRAYFYRAIIKPKETKVWGVVQICSLMPDSIKAYDDLRARLSRHLSKDSCEIEFIEFKRI